MLFGITKKKGGTRVQAAGFYLEQKHTHTSKTHTQKSSVKKKSERVFPAIRTRLLANHVFIWRARCFWLLLRSAH